MMISREFCCLNKAFKMVRAYKVNENLYIADFKNILDFPLDNLHLLDIEKHHKELNIVLHKLAEE